MASIKIGIKNARDPADTEAGMMTTLATSWERNCNNDDQSFRSHASRNTAGLVEASGHAAVRAVRGRPSDGKAHY
jgi:hypothetical protein